MKKQVIVRVLLGVLALLLVAGLVVQFTPAIGSLSGSSGTPALKVAGQTITAQQLDNARQANQLLSSVRTGLLGDDFETVVADQLVTQTLLQQAAADQKVSRADVNAEVTKTRESNNLTDNKAWTDALRNAGFSDSSYREQVRNSLAVQRKAKAIQDAAPKPTEAQIRMYYDLNPQTFQSDARIVGREIVVDTKAKADQLLAQLKKGADFAALASANSLENKDRGGALAALENGKPKPVAQVALPQEVGVAAFALTSGGLTDVIKSGERYYIVKVEQFLAPSTKPYSEAKASATDAVANQLKNQAVEAWIDSLRQNVKVEVVDPAWPYNDPAVATVNGQKIPYTEVLAAMLNNQQFAALLQQASPDQAAPLVNSFLKPSIVQSLIQQYAAPIIVKAQKLPLVGSRGELLSGLTAYGARDVKVSDADVQAYYKAHQKEFQTQASATVSTASFKDKQQALAFRQAFKSGDFTKAASKAGGTVAERGAVTQGDSKLTGALETAVFATDRLQPAGEGSLSDVAQENGRYVVAYLTDLVRASVKPLAEVQSTIQSQLLAQKQQTAGQAYLTAQLKTIKTQDLLSSVLAAQAKRVAAQTPSSPSSPSAPSTPAK
ncbi:peptidyl-prolyl cis-trans isomerase [Deinococcus sonorensis]|uniref:peptidylprolyl isomerase n=2 Tax=Deinococcus sonorensis TaxID=309891 RepID=A0AAU7U7Q1_9DEIO